MNKSLQLCIVGIFMILFSSSVYAIAPASHLNKEDAIKIISTLERLNARHYKVIHIADGTQRDKDGFQHDIAKKVSFYGPRDVSDTSRCLRHVIMLYSVEYGWYLQKSDRDARGPFLEISSQKQDRVFVR
ncbi:MAG: hypothetical protein KJO79_00545 [Verrucomicrobiae bacterium]|nr:hypothetical protein [Verrucomicrobiae bacterium]NNJ85631.1 hypothetical protein [Akkermansiaceae bacterium]